MKPLPLILLIAATGTAFADLPFADRAKRAKTIEESPEGQAYQKVLWQQVGDHTQAVMQQCFPKDAILDTDSFTLVANVLASGVLTNVEVQPSTPMSQCFAKRFAEPIFPKPPATFGKDGIPLVVDMTIKP